MPKKIFAILVLSHLLPCFSPYGGTILNRRPRRVGMGAGAQGVVEGGPSKRHLEPDPFVGYSIEVGYPLYPL